MPPLRERPAVPDSHRFGVSALVFFLALFPCLQLFCEAPQPSGSTQLKQLTLEQLGDLHVVTASKAPQQVLRTPAAVYVITQDDIQRSGAKSLPDILRLAPGVEVAQIDSSTFSVGIRGFGSRLARSVLVLIDGRSVYTPLFAGVYWEMQDTLLQDIDRIEVIRGPGATLWGSNAVNGVINIITKDAHETQGTSVEVGGGSVDQGFLSARYGGQWNGVSYRVWGKGFTRGPQFHPNGDNFDDWRRGQFGFRSDWNRGRDQFTLQSDYYTSAVGESLNVSTYSPPAITAVERNIALSGGNVMMRWKRDLSGNSNFTLQAYFDRTNRRDINYGEVRNTFDVDFVHHISGHGYDLNWGVGARISPSDYTQVVPTVDFIPHQQTYNLFSAFVENQFTLAPDRLFFTVGTKLEHNSFSGFEVQPSGRLLWTPSKRQSVWAAVTRAVRTPSRVEQGFRYTSLIVPALPLYVRLVGDGGFTSEQMLGYELGYRALLGAALYIDVAAFYNQYTDLLSVEASPLLVETNPGPPHLILPLLLRNGLKGETRGVEIAPIWNVTDRLRLRGSYSFLNLNTRLQPGSIDASTVGQTEGASPAHMATMQSFLRLPANFELDLTLRYVSALKNPVVDAYTTADARLGWGLSEHVGLSIAGRNLFQSSHVEFTGFPGPPVEIKRSVYAQITYTH